MEYPKSTQSTLRFAKFAEVLLDLGIQKSLEYGIPDHLLSVIAPGVQVQIPLRNKFYKGIVIQVKSESSFPSVSPINNIIQDELINAELFELALWMSKYYQAPLGEVLKAILPAPVRKNHKEKTQFVIYRNKSKEELQKTCIELREKSPIQAEVLDVMLLAHKGMFLTELMEKAEVSNSPIESLVKKGFLLKEKVKIDRSPLINEEYFKTHPKTLNSQQQAALSSIADTIDQKMFQTHLLFGITGSGKTEIYLQAIEHAKKSGYGAIMLIPEISLTAQTIERFRSRFEGNIAILHSGLSAGERFDEWHRIKQGKAQIIIGARSALFSPITNLGLIIVDEEHDNAYKQSERAPCYHARDVAVMRGKLSKSAVILGSATPSLESYHNAAIGKYKLHVLNYRADSAVVPKVKIIDLKKEFAKAQGYTSFSEDLIDAIKKRYSSGEQVLLFLNRRGYHSSLFCQCCGTVFKCPHCDLALTFHYQARYLGCHLCDFHLSPPPKSCQNCGKSDALKYKGVGTEQIERSLHALFPGIRTLRMDADTTKHKGSHEKIFRAFSTGKADILIGTQMVAKGLHFPAVTLVAILNNDAGLNIPDFRASEHNFQLMTQVAGRSGRGHLPGEVIIQTHLPENPLIHMAAEQDYELFYKKEIEVRKYFSYPPYTHFVKCTFSGKDQALVEASGNKVRESVIKELNSAFTIHPLIASGYAKVKDQYRFQFLIRGSSVYTINEHLQKILVRLPLPNGIRLLIDVDPTSTFF